MNFFRGYAFSLILAVPLWAVIVFVAAALAGCGRSDDGMGDLWKGVKYIQERR